MNHRRPGSSEAPKSSRFRPGPDGERWFKFLRYVVQGAGLNLTGLGIFWILTLALSQAEPLLLNILTSVLLLPLSFIVNRVWVFRSHAALSPQIRSFLLVYFAAGVASAIAFAVLSMFVSLPPVVIQALTTSCVVIGGFLANYFWTFSRK